MKIISWNVAGLRACIKKGLLGFIKEENADIYCFQEIKASKEICSRDLDLKDYNLYCYPAVKPGYSGTLVLSKNKPLSVIEGVGNKDIDREGSVLALEFNKFFLINSYFPHSSRDLSRLDFKLKFNDIFERFCERLDKKKPVVIASDFNVAHKEIDLANPKQNEKNAGFTIQERKWFDSFLNKGYVDTFREFVKGNGHYTWWTYRFGARKRNVGWRVDYFIISKRLRNKLKNSEILDKIMGSDHCPIRLEII